MAVFTAYSKKDQVVQALRQKILSGKIDPGTRLQSVRKLAQKFSVSSQIIVNAFDVLEAEQLIRRMHGSGVYVRGRSSEDLLDVCLLGYRAFDEQDLYFSNLSKIAYPPVLREGFSFLLRIIPPSRSFTDERFALELKKIEQHLGVDSLLINAPTLSKERLEACLKLQTPLVFIGDFLHGPYEDMVFNQITSDNAVIGRQCIRLLHEQTGEKEFNIYSGSLDNYFENDYYQGALTEANELGVKLNFVEVSCGESLEFVNKNAPKEFSNCPGIKAVGSSVAWLQQLLDESGMNNDLYVHEKTEESSNLFFDIIYDRINELSERPKEFKRIILEQDIVIKKVNKIKTIKKGEKQYALA
jgi:Bacterial regulatory proteins, gntR family